ncbi:hypothetical protein ACFWY5_31500 [Nonomuraea sp. NPDC059007]|uniref:hypothetical protein n=1 Tax=Nonomuraea sp. NPDC059007 TaxID=3346692 RepID=UPI00369EF84C
MLREQRTTTLAALHDLNAAATVCDRLHVLHEGADRGPGAAGEALTAGAGGGGRPSAAGRVLIAFDHTTPVA